MPGRTSTRSTRTSGASTGRKSARASSNAVEIPDEGPLTLLRTQVAQVFGEAQKTTTIQRKLIVTLRKIQEACCFEPPETGKKGSKAAAEIQDDFDESDFNDEMVRCLLRVLTIKKSEPAADRIIKFLGEFLVYASNKDNAIFMDVDSQETDVSPETPTSRLVSHLILTILGFMNAKDKTIRFRSTQVVVHMVNSMDTLDDDIYNMIRLGLLERLRDREAPVRMQAAHGLGRLAGDPEDDDDGILKKLLDVMAHDPSAEVRRTVVRNCIFSKDTLPYILERSRDTDVATRRVVYNRVLPKLGDFRHMSLKQREKVLRWGLRDRDDQVRKSAARLFRERWLEDCAGSHDTKTEEEKKPGSVAPPSLEALTELLERISVTDAGREGGMAHDAMRHFWEGRPDYREAVNFNHEFWQNLDAHTVFVARTLNDYFLDTDDNHNLIEDKMPEVTMFAFIVQKELNEMIQCVEAEVALEENDPNISEVVEDREEKEFIVEQLLHIAMTLDYTDEVGRRQMYNIMREAIAKAQLPEECTRLAIDVLRTICGSRGEAEFCALIVEAIAEVRDTLLGDDDDDTVKGDNDDESFHSAQSDIGDDADGIVKSKKSKKVLTPEEEEEEALRKVMVYAKCLHIAQCTFQNVHCELETENSLTILLNTLVIPAIQQKGESMIRERGLICLGLACLLSKNLAANNFALLFYCYENANYALSEIVVQVLTDIIITWPEFLVSPAPGVEATIESAAPKPSRLIKSLLRIVLDALGAEELNEAKAESDPDGTAKKTLRLAACIAASKLLLLGLLPEEATTAILEEFTQIYFDPETAQHPALRQALSYFLPVFCHSKLKNARLMSQIAVPIMGELLSKRDDEYEGEGDDMVGWPVITAHLAEWTDGRKVVGATELGLDGKTSTSTEAEESHISLAVAVLERALTNTCSKLERKPLLSLLSKLYIAPASAKDAGSEEELVTLHSLVTEAVEGMIGMDATQRNFLTKLEATLTKRLGEVEHATPVPDEAEDAATPTADADDASQVDATEVADNVKGDVDGSEISDEDEEDETMLAGMQGEGTRMPLEDDEDEEDEGNTTVAALPVRKRAQPTLTEDDIMQSLLASEMEM